MLYGLKLDQEVGLQVICATEGVAFEQLPDLVFEIDGLSEFEQHHAARLLKSVNRRPCTSVTNLSHLIKEPMMSFCSQPEDAVQYKMEIYQLADKSAEIVMEYPTDNTQMPWFALMSQPKRSTSVDFGPRSVANDLAPAESASVELEGDSVGEAAQSADPVVSCQASNSAQIQQQTWESNCERLTFALSEKEMRSLLSLCRRVSGR